MSRASTTVKERQTKPPLSMTNMQFEFPWYYKWLLLAGLPLALLISSILGNNAEIEALVREFETGDKARKFQVLASLRSRGSGASSALNTLSRYLTDFDPEIRRETARTMIQIDRHEATEYLITALHIKDTATRLDIQDALERAGTKESVAAVRELNSRAKQKYQRTRLDKWAGRIRRTQELQTEKAYRKHRRAYSSRR